MPEKPPSSRERPVIPLFAGAGGRQPRPRAREPGEPAYAELLAASNFSFLRGSSHPEELAATATFLGLAGFAIADRNTLAGVVRGHLAARSRPVPAMPSAAASPSGTERRMSPSGRPIAPPTAGFAGYSPPAISAPRKAEMRPPPDRPPANGGQGLETWRCFREGGRDAAGCPVGVDCAEGHPLPSRERVGQSSTALLKTRSPLSPRPFPAMCGLARPASIMAMTAGGLRNSPHLPHATASRCWRSATCSITRRSAAACRTCSPACAST